MVEIGRAELAAARGAVAFGGRVLARYRLRWFGIMGLVFAVVLFALGLLTGGGIGAAVVALAVLLGITTGLGATAVHRLLGRAERLVGGADYPTVRPIVDRHHRELRAVVDDVRDQLGPLGILRLVRHPRRVDDRVREVAATVLPHAPAFLADVRRAFEPLSP